jgi:predicted DNA-binding transcriptional regulator AlpA
VGSFNHEARPFRHRDDIRLDLTSTRCGAVAGGRVESGVVGVEYMPIQDALDQIRTSTNMDEDQWREIEDMVRARIAGEGATIAGVSSEPDEPWTMPRTGKFLTQHDIARVLGLPAVNVRVWNNRGKLPKPSGYVGKRPMWLRSEIRQWCEELNELRCGVGSRPSWTGPHATGSRTVQE